MLSLAALLVLALPPFLVANAWMDLLGPRGWVGSLISLKLFGLAGVTGLLVLSLWPISFLACSAALSQLSHEHLEVETALTGTGLLRRLILPLVSRGAWVSGVLIFVLALNQFSIPSLLQVKVLSAEMWVRYSTELNAGSAFATGWPLIVLPIVVALLWRPSRRDPFGAGDGLTWKVFQKQLGVGWTYGLAGCGVVLVSLSLGVPFVQLVASQRTWMEMIPAGAASLTALSHSALDAVVVATVVVLLSLLLQERARPVALDAVTLCMLLIPGTLLALSALQVADQWLGGAGRLGRGLVIAVLALRYSGLAWYGVGWVREGLDRDLVDAAQLGRSTAFQRFKHVTWAQRSHGMVAVWYSIYLLVLWDVEVMVLLQPPGGETLALRIFNLLHYGHNDQVNALCLLLLLLAILPWMAWSISTSVRRFAASRPLSVFVLIWFGLCGCSPTPQEKEAPLKSRVFSRVELVGGRGTSAGLFNKPRSLTVDRLDQLYVVDMTGRVQKFSPSGEFLLMWQLPQTDLGKPKGMACDPDGNIVVVEPHYQRVNHFTPEGKLVRRWGVSGTNAGQLTLPRSVAVNSKGVMFLSEYTTVDRVQGFQWPATTPLYLFGKPGLNPGEFNRAEGITIDSKDQIWVADSCNHRIQVFTPDGRFLREHGKAGSAPGELSYPYDLRIDQKGRQIVCEFGNSRIQIFDQGDQPLEVLGGYGDGLGEFSNPWAIALDSKGNLYVADAGNHRVQKFIARDP